MAAVRPWHVSPGLLGSKQGLDFLLAYTLLTSFLFLCTNAMSIRDITWELEASSISRIIQMPLGYVKGVACPFAPAVTQFLGVPFAEPPLGKFRYRRAIMYNTTYPVPALEATKIPPPCGSLCSLSTTPLTDTADSQYLSSENCLFVTIWTPAQAPFDGSKLPIRVFIHGGEINVCSASDEHLNGCAATVKTGMIHINIQFRRGPFGLFAHPLTMAESNTTGNWAFLDQQLALEWVQKHAAYFGGDPTKVMINGQSGGAQQVEFHQVAPGSAGLFSSAISQSPPCVKLIPLEESYGFSQRFMEMAGCAPLGSPEAELECMRSASWADLMQLSRDLATTNFARLLLCEGAFWYDYFHYTLDGSVFPYQPQEALALGQFHKVPFLVGSTTNEGSYFVSDMNTYMASRGVTRIHSVIPAILEELYPTANLTGLLMFYENAFPNDTASEDTMLARIWTDIFFTCPIHKRMVARSQHTVVPSYLYNWNITPTCPPETVYMGPTHTAEIRFCFGATSHIPSTLIPNGFCDFTPEEVAVSDAVLHVWRSMAEEQVPRWPSGAPWPRWKEPTEAGVFWSMGNTRIESLKPGEQCRILDGLLRVAIDSHDQ